MFLTVVSYFYFYFWIEFSLKKIDKTESEPDDPEDTTYIPPSNPPTPASSDVENEISEDDTQQKNLLYPDLAH